MKIKNIKKLSNGKYQITFDNKTKLITYDEVILKYNLLYDKDITSEDLKELNTLNDYYSVYNEVIKFLTKRVRSKKEYYDYISKYELSLKDKDRLTKEMKSLKLLDDSLYAKAYVSDKFYLSNDGPYKIKKTLIDNNIPEDIIENELSMISEDDLNEKVLKLITKKKKISKGSSYLIKQKIKEEMYNLGYDKKIVDIYLNEDLDDSKSLEHDFNKYYSSISRKEKDIDALYFKIKQKLYQKGYSISKIDELISNKK